MDADGTSSKSLLAEMAHEVFKDRRQVSMLELASKKVITITSKQALKLSFMLKLLCNKPKKLPAPSRNGILEAGEKEAYKSCPRFYVRY